MHEQRVQEELCRHGFNKSAGTLAEELRTWECKCVRVCVHVRVCVGGWVGVCVCGYI